jgi:hypothetical protein
MKTCSDRNCPNINPQPLNNFNKNKKGINGLYCKCKQCQQRQNKNRYHGQNGRLKQWKNSIRKYWPSLSTDQAYQQYMNLHNYQKGLCAICELPETEVDAKYGNIKWLAVDHCHKTNKIRGLLCSKHNRGIGQLTDDPYLCLAAATYLWGEG